MVSVALQGSAKQETKHIWIHLQETETCVNQIYPNKPGVQYSGNNQEGVLKTQRYFEAKDDIFIVHAISKAHYTL